jgi:hypothetical protein
MPAVALADVLVDFGMRQMRAADAVPPQLVPVPVSQPSVGAIVAAEVARAEAALEDRLSLAHAAELGAARQRHQAEIAALQLRHGTEAGAAIAAACDALEQRFEQSVMAPVSRILGRLMSQDLSRRSAAELGRMIAAATRDRDAVRIVVSGPSALCQGVAEAIGERAAVVDFRETSGLDLAVSVDGALLETRIGEWSATLAEIAP